MSEKQRHNLFQKLSKSVKDIGDEQTIENVIYRIYI